MYSIVNNEAIGRIDALGLQIYDYPGSGAPPYNQSGFVPASGSAAPATATIFGIFDSNERGGGRFAGSEQLWQAVVSMCGRNTLGLSGLDAAGRDSLEDNLRSDRLTGNLDYLVLSDHGSPGNFTFGTTTFPNAFTLPAGLNIESLRSDIEVLQWERDSYFEGDRYTTRGGNETTHHERIDARISVIQAHIDQIEFLQWLGGLVKEGGGIIFASCDFGKGPTGLAAIQNIAFYTDRNVWGSTDEWKVRPHWIWVPTLGLANEVVHGGDVVSSRPNQSSVPVNEMPRPLYNLPGAAP